MKTSTNVSLDILTIALLRFDAKNEIKSKNFPPLCDDIAKATAGASERQGEYLNTTDVSPWLRFDVP